MKKRIQGIAIGFLVSTLMMGTVAFAATNTKQLNATFRDIKIVIDGNQITPKDANGNIVEPFVVDGTTYLPVRAVGEAFGKTVDWDGNTNTVYLSEKTTETPAPAPVQTTPAATETQKYTGRLDNQDSVNTYDFTLPYASRVTMEFEHEYVDSGSHYWKVQFIAKNGGVIFDFFAKGNAVTTPSSHAAYLPAGEYMVRISHSLYSNASYTVAINYRKNIGEFETEDNGTQENANPISIGNKITGNILDIEDVDFYKLSVASIMDVNISFEHEFIDSGSQFWKMQLIDSNGSTMIDEYVPGNTLQMNSATVSLNPGEYYVRISRNLHSNVDYSFVVNKK